MYIYIYIHTYICVYIYICTYIIIAFKQRAKSQADMVEIKFAAPVQVMPQRTAAECAFLEETKGVPRNGGRK